MGRKSYESVEQNQSTLVWVCGGKKYVKLQYEFISTGDKFSYWGLNAVKSGRMWTEVDNRIEYGWLNWWDISGIQCVTSK